ncbi:tail spike protein [Klebsiella phage vB_Kpn_K11PH164C1]|uniref:Probable tail spike protein n=1 Tax=Klebsiella phage vB_Kpn_K11PH164C1 TaxID=3071618 RepID=A0AAV1MFB8_9CAUD|nr:tail spike protein [Klebsiella phage vB_Kpn_K11PH164C1]
MLNDFNQPKGSTIGVLKDGRTIQQAFDEIPVISVLRFGAKGDGVADDYPAFQRAALEAQRIGGAVIDVPTPPVEYKIGFPVFLFDRTWFRGTGINCRVNFTDPLYARKSRSGFIIGSGYEQNRDKAIQCLNDGTWATTGSVVNSAFTELPRGQYVRDNPSQVQSRLCRVSDMYLVATYPNGTTLKGGYAVSGANAVDSDVFNIWGEGWTEIINFGSDVPPATPSCHNMHAYDITCVEPNHYETYYSAGFMANSTNCTIGRFRQLKPIADGSPHGSGGSMNYTEFCSFYDIDIPSLGRTASSEGILVNNSKGAVTRNIRIGNAKTCVAEYYTTGAGIFYDRDHPNVFDGIHANNCDNAAALRSKFSVWKNVTQTNCTYHVYFGTTNAQSCVVKFVPDSIGFGSGVDGLARLRDNRVNGYIERSVYVRPINFLLEDKTVLQSWDTNRNMKAKPDVGFRVLYPIPVNMRAIVSVNQFFTFEVGAGSKGSNVDIKVRRMASFGGNASEQPIIEFSNSKTATVDTVQDTNVQANAPALVLTATPDMPNSMDVLITVSNPTINMNLKEFRLVYLGD